MGVHVYGIRHHGPGCARALSAALTQLAPDVVLIEGPPDADETLPLLAAEGTVPPVALLVYAQEDPQNAAFYPFATFSPEWQALRYAAARGIPARFMDLPCAHQLAKRAQAADAAAADADIAPTPTPEASDTDPAHAAEGEALRDDPIALLAAASGFADPEQWWDAQVEQRVDPTGLFEAILEAMTALRDQNPEDKARELQREAYMRSVIRNAQKEGFQRIAVVCGAYHAPKLAQLGPAKADAELLKGLPKTKVTSTLVPWTNSRLAFRSGYGAGVQSPGFYAHVFEHGERTAVVWATLAARLLREQDLDASAANVIETVRLANALAALRELATPGLQELRDAISAVLTNAQDTRLALIHEKLEIGEALGSVPEHAGKVPLMRDFEQQVKRLRLKLNAEATPLELDLRKDNDRDRSQLLHRLRVLGVAWGTERAGKGAGTFRESWQLQWEPALAVELITANLRGSTVERAASATLSERAQRAQLAELTLMVEVALLAALPTAIATVLVELDARAAGSSDVITQMQALPPLARVARYGDVRETRAEHVLPVLRALFERAIVGLPSACVQLDDAAAAQLIAALNQAHTACALLDDPELKSDWLAALGKLSDSEPVHPRIRGRSCRLRLEHKALAEDELATLASLALSASAAPTQAAQWIEGLVEGEGLSLVHQEELIGVLDAWVARLQDDGFRAQLPLLRRAFSSLTASDRRSLAQRVKARVPGRDPQRKPVTAVALDPARVERMLPVLETILGVKHG